MTLGVIWALAVVSTVTRDLRATSAALFCQRRERVRSGPRKPWSGAEAAGEVPVPPSWVPLRSWSSTPGALAATVTEAIAAGGPAKEIWFHGTAWVILASS